jgi:hypothetical protein
MDILKEIKKRGLKISVIGIPKTIDNDINYIDKSFGMETAFSAACDSIYSAHTEAKEWAQAELVRSTATLRYEPCTQFINVSQRALHIYFIDGCRRIKSKTKTATCEQAPRSLFLF